MGRSSLKSIIPCFGVCLVCFGVNGRLDKPTDVEPDLDKLGVVEQ
jgi:hypothetical protein